MLKKLVNGKEVICSPEEEASILAQWDFVDQYPDYYDCIIFDEKLGGATHNKGIAIYNIEKAKEIHEKILQTKCDSCLKKLALEIENAEESGDATLRVQLVQKRKHLKNSVNMDLSSFKHIDELISSIPLEMRGL